MASTFPHFVNTIPMRKTEYYTIPSLFVTIYMLHIGNPGVNNEVGFLSHVSHYNSHHVLIPTDHFSSVAANPLDLSMSSM